MRIVFCGRRAKGALAACSDEGGGSRPGPAPQLLIYGPENLYTCRDRREAETCATCTAAQTRETRPSRCSASCLPNRNMWRCLPRTKQVRFRTCQGCKTGSGSRLVVTLGAHAPGPRLVEPRQGPGHVALTRHRDGASPSRFHLRALEAPPGSRAVGREARRGCRERRGGESLTGCQKPVSKV